MPPETSEQTAFIVEEGLLSCTTWKTRPLSPEQTQRMMATWAQLEPEAEADPNTERLCWFIFGNGSGGFTVSRVADEAAPTSGLESALALGEFTELETRPVMDLESTMPTPEFVDANRALDTDDTVGR